MHPPISPWYPSYWLKRGGLSLILCFLPVVVCVIWRKWCSSKHLQSCSRAKSLVPSNRDILSEFVSRHVFRSCTTAKHYGTLILSQPSSGVCTVMEAESRRRPEVEFLKRPLTSIVCRTHRPKSAVMLVRGTRAADRVLHIESDWDRRMNKYMLLFSVNVVY